MSQAQVDHHDDDDDGSEMIAVDVIGIRMECLRLVLTECKGVVEAGDAIVTASSFVSFVIDGTTPAKRN